MSGEALTYTSLLSDVSTYCERNEQPFMAQIPRFIMLAENRLAMNARGLGFQKYVTGSFNTPSFAKPERWRETISFRIDTVDGTKFLQQRSYDYCRVFPATAAEPRYYADYSYEHFFIAPAPDQAYDFELAYYERPEPLSAQNQTNWTTRYAPQLLLYATLLEAQPFLKRPDLQQVWQAAYNEALQGLAQETTRRVGGDRASSVRNGE